MKSNHKKQYKPNEKKSSVKNNPQEFFDHRKTVIFLLIILLISFLSYLPVFRNTLLNWDDEGYIKHNAMVHLFNLKGIFSEYVMGNYHPLTMLIYAVQYHFFGLNPTGYHVVNLFIHLVNTVLVFYSLYLLSNKIAVGIVASLLFGIHPMHVESVAWAAELKDLLYTCFFLVSSIFYLKYLKETNRKYYLFSLTFFLISLLSKAMAASLPLVLILIDYLKGRKINLNTLLEKAPYFMLALIFGIIAIWAQKSSDSIINTTVISFPQRIVFAAYGFMTYLSKLILPLNLCAFYPYPVRNGEVYIPGLYYAYPIIAIALTTLVIYVSKYSRKILFGFGFFVLTILLVLQLLPVGKAIMADRYSYIPSIGIFYLAGEGLVYLWNTHQKAIAVVGLSLMGLIFPARTYARCGVWENDLIFWNDVIAQYQTVEDAYYNRGIIYMNDKKNQEAKNDFDKTIELKPDYSKAYNNKGLILLNENNHSEALIHFNKAIEVKPNNSEAYYNRGTLYSAENRNEEALRDFNQAIMINPEYTEAFNNRGSVFVKEKRIDEAIKDFTRAIALNPENAEAYYNLGVLLMNEKRNTEAIDKFNQAIALKADYANAFNNRGIVYVNEKRNAEAIEDFTRLIALQPNNANAYNNRGIVFLNEKRNAEAMNDFEIAIRINPQFIGAHYNLANLLFEEKKYEEAIEFYSQVIALKDNYAQAWYKKGLAEYYSGRKLPACQDLEQALRLGSREASTAISQVCR